MEFARIKEPIVPFDLYGNTKMKQFFIDYHVKGRTIDDIQERRGYRNDVYIKRKLSYIHYIQTNTLPLPGRRSQFSPYDDVIWTLEDLRSSASGLLKHLWSRRYINQGQRTYLESIMDKIDRRLSK